MMNKYGIDVQFDEEALRFSYGPGVIGPVTEIRCLDDIRGSLRYPECNGPDKLYGIAMDVYCEEDRKGLFDRNLLYGIVAYAKGQMGHEPVRSQGHIHAVSDSCGASTCEVYEIWQGEAYIYMQESGEEDAGRCFAVYAKQGDVVIVPPGWVHATVNANTEKAMAFAAWCVRDYGFDYKQVRAHKGIAYFPMVQNREISWSGNPEYRSSCLEVKKARTYEELCIEAGVSIYEQYQKDSDRFLFVSKPQNITVTWEELLP